MSQNLQNFAKFQKFQLDNLVDFEKCCPTHIFLQKSEPIQPKTSNIFPKFCQPTLSDVSAGPPTAGPAAGSAGAPAPAKGGPPGASAPQPTAHSPPGGSFGSRFCKISNSERCKSVFFMVFPIGFQRCKSV